MPRLLQAAHEWQRVSGVGADAMAPVGVSQGAITTLEATEDLGSIHDDVAGFDSAARANHVLDRSMEVVDGLARFPERGS